MNCYLVREPDGLTLVDSALACASIIREAARHMGAPIRRILLTHGHIDHAGSVDALRKTLPEIEVICGAREARLIAEAHRDVKPKDMTLLPEEPREVVKGTFSKLKEEPSRHVREGDSIGSLQAFATPGHTPGHVSFYDPRDGSFYAGDALVTFGGVRAPFDPAPWFPLPKSATWHFPTALASMKKVDGLRLPLRHLLPGHGPAIADPNEGLRHAITRGEAKLAG